jgi:hypothetical protein
MTPKPYHPASGATWEFCSPLTAYVFQVPLEAFLVVEARLGRAVGYKRACQGVELLSLRSTLLAAQVAQAFHAVQTFDASDPCHLLMVCWSKVIHDSTSKLMLRSATTGRGRAGWSHRARPLRWCKAGRCLGCTHFTYGRGDAMQRPQGSKQPSLCMSKH